MKIALDLPYLVLLFVATIFLAPPELFDFTTDFALHYNPLRALTLPFSALNKPIGGAGDRPEIHLVLLGFGNVGQSLVRQLMAARKFHHWRLGMKLSIEAISDSSGTFIRPGDKDGGTFTEAHLIMLRFRVRVDRNCNPRQFVGPS